MMEDDEIMKELRAVRTAYARKFNYDIKKMFEDLARRQTARLEKVKRKRKPARPAVAKSVGKPRKPRRAA